jgi:hypothetical protein
MPLRSYHTAIRVLPPQPYEPNDVLHYGNGSEQGGANAEHGVRRKLVARKAIPHSEVETNWHEDAVQYDQQPKPKDSLLPRAQRVVQGWRLVEVDVGEHDLGVREGCIPERWRMAGIASCHWSCGPCACGVLLARAINAHGLSWYHECRWRLGM